MSDKYKYECESWKNKFQDQFGDKNSLEKQVISLKQQTTKLRDDLEQYQTEKDMWKKTGNICVEYESYGKASGIEATESDVWIHNLTSNDEFVLGFIIPTETLKKIYKQGYPVKGGDHNASRIYLLKIKELVDKILKEKVQ